MGKVGVSWVEPESFSIETRSLFGSAEPGFCLRFGVVGRAGVVGIVLCRVDGAVVAASNKKGFPDEYLMRELLVGFRRTLLWMSPVGWD